MREREANVARIRDDRPGRILHWGRGFGQVSDRLRQSGIQITPFDDRPEIEEAVVAPGRYSQARATATRAAPRSPTARSTPC